jgi:hypothetical protein
MDTENFFERKKLLLGLLRIFSVLAKPPTHVFNVKCWYIVVLMI